MDKIYSRKRLIIPKLNIGIFHKKNNNNFENNPKLKKILQVLNMNHGTIDMLE